jgi:cytochrome c
MINEEGGVDPEQFRIEALIERMNVMGKAFLGLTVNCCQCHNHKYDPISQKEYYRLFAFLNNDDEPQLEVPNKYEEPERDAIRHKIATMEEDLLTQFPDIPKKMAAWEDEMKALPRDWTVLTSWRIIPCWPAAPFRQCRNTPSLPTPP